MKTQAVNDLKTKQEGEEAVLNPTYLDMSDEELAQAIGSRIETAQGYWNNELDLDNKCQINKRYWKAYDNINKDLYPYQVDYNDPVAAVAVETLLPMETSKPPQPIVIPFDPVDEAQSEIAENLQAALLTKYEDQYLKGKSMQVVRHLSMGMRRAWFKLAWDKNMGGFKEDGSRTGDFTVEVIQPQNVIAEDCKDKADIPLIAEKQTALLEEWATRYPDKRNALYEAAGVSAGVSGNITKRLTIYETHFTNYKDNKKTEAIVWKYKHVILDKMKSPFWNYDESYTDADGKTYPTNFLPFAQKPYILFTHMNTGEYLFDDNSLMDLARNQQDIVNKRGRQIVENADQANSGLIYDTETIAPEKMALLIGDPGEKIGVKGDVNKAVTRLPPPQLLPYVFNDKQDARNRVNDIFGTNNPIRGQESQSQTLGQDVLSQRSDMSRGITMSTSIEDGFDRLYKYMVQIWKVFNDENTQIPITNSDGATVNIYLPGDKIRPKAVRVKTGSTIPEDPVTKSVEAQKLAPVLDPYTLVDRLGWQNPKEVANRIVLYRLAPDRYLQEILGTDPMGQAADPSAVQETQFMEQGQEAPPQTNPTKAHLATHQQLIEAPEFKRAPPNIQAMILAHVKAENENAKQNLGMKTNNGSQNMPNDGQMGGSMMGMNQNQPPQANTAPPPQEKKGLLSRIFNRK